MAAVEANFSSALATWKGKAPGRLSRCTTNPPLGADHPVSLYTTEIDLAETQKQLDKTALELVENQKENLVGRKKLAEQTRGEGRRRPPRSYL